MSQKNVNIPGPRPWPVVGNLLLFFKSKNIGETYRQLQRKYGDLVKLKMGQGNLVVVFGYKNIREVLVDNSDKTKFRPLVKAIFPDGNGEFILAIYFCFGNIFLYSSYRIPGHLAPPYLFAVSWFLIRDPAKNRIQQMFNLKRNMLNCLIFEFQILSRKAYISQFAV